MKIEPKIYTRRPAVCEAYGPVQDDGPWCMAVARLVDGEAHLMSSGWGIEIMFDLEEWRARKGDYLVENGGYFIPMSAERFHALYEEA